MAAFRIKIQPADSKALGFADLSRTALLRLLTRLLTELPKEVELFRQRRLADQPDCFEYRAAIFDDDQDEPRRYLFRFAVNDKLSETILHLVNVRFSSRAGPPDIR